MPRFLLFLALLAPTVSLAELDISDAWIKNLPPSVPVRAGTLHNAQSKTQRIVAVHSESFASVEIHQTLMQDGMMRMEQVPALQIEPGETVQLAPGGLHLMMMQPAQPTRPGEVHRIEIEFEDGSRQSLQMTVRK
ncbi:MAG: copper chaperone PCu(A)C [Gammaproteobacteria bacterium]|nr:MAG: copper chaperone PCu(A)C [Gammaproteobacteria bacterium]